MEQLLKFNLELKKKNFFHLSIITEFNNFVSQNFDTIIDIYKLTFNKSYVLQELIVLGKIIENISTRAEDVISIQLSSFSNLYQPIIIKIKEICFELNNEIINDLNNYLDIYLKKDKSNLDNHKTIKSLLIFSNIKIYYNTKLNEIPFDDFGICIKTSNLNDKELVKNIIETLNIFKFPNSLILKKKIDWIWKAIDLNIKASDQYFINIDTIDSNITENATNVNDNENNYILDNNNINDCIINDTDFNIDDTDRVNEN